MNGVNNLKAIARAAGDRSVGIEPDEVEFALRRALTDDTDRAEVRGKIEKCLGMLWDEPVAVRFSDECPDCGGRDGNHKPNTVCTIDYIDE